ncbi:hypothetical protein ACFE04_000152 [Oxalis oulophora]
MARKYNSESSDSDAKDSRRRHGDKKESRSDSRRDRGDEIDDSSDSDRRDKKQYAKRGKDYVGGRERGYDKDERDERDNSDDRENVQTMIEKRSNGGKADKETGEISDEGDMQLQDKRHTEDREKLREREKGRRETRRNDDRHRRREAFDEDKDSQLSSDGDDSRRKRDRRERDRNREKEDDYRRKDRYSHRASRNEDDRSAYLKSERDTDRSYRGRDEDDKNYRREKERNDRREDTHDKNPVQVPKPIKQSSVQVGKSIVDSGKTGGVYIPPFKLARMMKEVEDKSSVEYQRLTWDALRKSINGLVNKVNAANIKNIIPELLGENLIRGRGLFCRSCMKSQMASPAFTHVFAAIVAVVNTKFPEIGDLLLRRIVLQLKRAYKRNDKPQLLAAVKFIAHLVNQQVAHEIIALELLTILLENPTDDSVEVAVGFVTECGSILQDLTPKGLHGIFERFRGILHEGEIDKRVQFMIEGLFAIRKAKFQGYPAVKPELDLVEQEDQLTHEVSLEDEIDPEITLDFEEAGHKLLKIKLEPGQEFLLGDQNPYLTLSLLACVDGVVHYVAGVLQSREDVPSLLWALRPKFFAHLLGTDALPWHCLAYIRLTEEDTTSSSRIFIKILFQELSEHLGIQLLNKRLTDPAMQESYESIFPRDNPKNTRFAINFFTSIGLGGITENLREYLKNMPRLIMQQQKPPSESESDDDSSGSGSSGSDSESESESSSSDDSDRDRRKKKRSRRN